MTQEMYDAVDGFIKEMTSTQKSLEGLAHTIGANLQQTESDLEQGLLLGTETPETVAEKLGNIETRLYMQIGLKQEAIEAKLDKLLGDIERIDKRSLGEIVADDLRQKWDNFKNFSKQAVDTVKGVFASMKDAVRNGVTKIAESTRDFFRYTKAVAQDKLEKLNDFADRKKAELDADIAFTIKQPLQKAGEAVAHGLTETVNAMRDAVTDTKVAIATTVQKANRFLNEGKMDICQKLEKKLEDKMQEYADRREKLNGKLNEKEDAEKSEKE